MLVTLDLDHYDLLALVQGQSPRQLALIDQLSAQDYGHFTGGHVDQWTWHPATLATLPDPELLTLYQQCKAAEATH